MGSHRVRHDRNDLAAATYGSPGGSALGWVQQGWVGLVLHVFHPLFVKTEYPGHCLAEAQGAYVLFTAQFSSVQLSHSVMSDSLPPH